MSKIIIPGGSGFLGLYLAKHFVQLGWEVIILTRKSKPSKDGISYVAWDGKTLGEWAKEFEGADAVINMAGRTVNCRYTEKNKAEILNSRIDSTRILGEAIAQCQNPPKVWINSSSATYYKDTRGDLPANDEYNGQTGEDFSMGVCKAWEKAFNECTCPKTRKIALRSTIVIGKGGGAMEPLLNLVKSFMGGTQGSGEQFISWVHLEDFARICAFLVEKGHIDGVINCAAPNPLPNKDFMRLLRKAAGRPFGMPMPEPLLRFGAIFIQTEVELILKSRKVVSKRLAEEGFEFKYPKVEEAFAEIVS